MKSILSSSPSQFSFGLSPLRIARACGVAAVLAFAVTGCSGSSNGSDDGSSDDAVVQQSDAETAAKLAELVANGDSATLARVTDMQEVRSSDANIGAWSAYTLRPESEGQKGDEDLTAAPPTEMLFVSEGAAVPAVFYVNAAGGQAVAAPENLDADKLRARLVADLKANAASAATDSANAAGGDANANAATGDTNANAGSGASNGVSTQSLAGSALHLDGVGGELATQATERLVDTATRFLEKEGRELFEGAFKQAKVEVKITGETHSGAQVHIKEVLAEHSDGAFKVHARAPRLAEHLGLGPLSEYQLAILKQFAPRTTLFGAEGAQHFAAGASSRGMVFGTWTTYTTLGAGVKEMVVASGGRVVTVSSALHVAEGGGAPKVVQVSTTEQALALAEEAQTLAAKGVSMPFSNVDTQVVVGHAEGTALEVGLSGVSDVYMGSASAKNYPFMLEVVLDGKTLHVENDAVATSFRAYVTGLLKEPNACVQTYCDVQSIMGRVQVL